MKNVFFTRTIGPGAGRSGLAIAGEAGRVRVTAGLVLCAIVLSSSLSTPSFASSEPSGSALALVQGFDQFSQGAKDAGRSIVSVIVNVIFIILALACVGYGVAQLLAGRIGLFVLCIVGAVVLALSPEFIAKTFSATQSTNLIK